jgi:hypothetical protein
MSTLAPRHYDPLAIMILLLEVVAEAAESAAKPLILEDQVV